ncbi:hypothetical protein [uncultured Erythrobacter sp.]|uniref:hypothetical protein n=1 Tax=uncultured Erythrobacter sp. TaxID=263913 RepID=UPI0026158938|nr:hypothetical protein [uncultured Erythrobacter sp.]
MATGRIDDVDAANICAVDSAPDAEASDNWVGSKESELGKSISASGLAEAPIQSTAGS